VSWLHIRRAGCEEGGKQCGKVWRDCANGAWFRANLSCERARLPRLRVLDPHTATFAVRPPCRKSGSVCWSIARRRLRPPSGASYTALFKEKAFLLEFAATFSDWEVATGPAATFKAGASYPALFRRDGGCLLKVGRLEGTDRTGDYSCFRNIFDA